MGVHRVELTGFDDLMRDRLRAYGLFGEIISWKLRLFVPTGANGHLIIGALMERYPLVRIADRAAAPNPWFASAAGLRYRDRPLIPDSSVGRASGC